LFISLDDLQRKPLVKIQKGILKCMLLLLTIQLASLRGHSQDLERLSGRIINAETQAPIPFASVGIPGRQIGISADLNGFFDLDVTQQAKGDSLKVSCIGYEEYAINTADLDLSQMSIFQLKNKTTIQEDVLIEGESLNAVDIVLNAFKNLKKHLRITPYFVENRYREYVKVDGKYKGFTEAVGMLYMSGYNRKYNSFRNKSYTYDIAQWKHIRRSNYDVSLRNNRPDYLFTDKLIKTKDFYTYNGPIQKSQISKINYFVDSLTTYDDKLVYVVQFKPKKEFENNIKYEGTALIKSNDYAVLSLELHDHSSSPIMGMNKRKRVSNNFNVFLIKYAQFEEKYYVSYMKLFNVYHIELDGEVVKTEEVMEMIDGRFYDNKPQELNYGQRTILFSEMVNPSIVYAPDFWNNSNLSKFPQIEAVREDLEKDISLEQQFNQNHGKRIVPIPQGFKNYQELYLDREAFDLFFPN